MAGLGPAIHYFTRGAAENKSWMPGTRPGMTVRRCRVGITPAHIPCGSGEWLGAYAAIPPAACRRRDAGEAEGLPAWLVHKRRDAEIGRPRAAAIEPAGDIREGRKIDRGDSGDSLLARFAQSRGEVEIAG